jgi:hypothetical protein
VSQDFRFAPLSSRRLADRAERSDEDFAVSQDFRFAPLRLRQLVDVTTGANGLTRILQCPRISALPRFARAGWVTGLNRYRGSLQRR